MTPRPFLLVLALASTLACGDDGGAEGSDEAETSTSATDTTDATDTNTSDTNTSDTGEGECTIEGDAQVAFSLTGVDVGQALDWALTCTVASVGPASSGTAIMLSQCSEAAPGPNPAPTELELVVDSTPPSQPLIQLGQTLQLHWVQEPPFYAGRWFTLRSEGDTLLLAGIDGPSILPPNSPSFGFDPVEVTFVGSSCELVDASGCAMAQRWGLELGWDGVTTTIADSNAGYVGQLVSYHGIVDAAIQYSDIVCDDFASATIVALLVLIPEG